MAAKGTNAKLEVTNKIAEIFGEDYIGEVDKKLYIWQNDGNERVQIAIALTCPKNFIEAVDKNPKKTQEDWDFSSEGSAAPAPKAKAQITEEEKQRVAELMKSLGL